MFIKERTLREKNITFLKRFSNPKSLFCFSLSFIFIIGYFEVFILNSCELASFVTSLACFIAKDKSVNELNLLSTVFSQLGDTLQTIVASKACE